MSKKLVFLACLVLVLGLVGSASAELLVHWKFDEGSGAIATDTSGNGRDGTITGDPQWVPGLIGDGALHFDGADDFVSHVLPGGDQTYAAFTIGVWVKADDVPQAASAGVFSSRFPGGATGAGFQIDLSPTVYRIRNNTGGSGDIGDVGTDWVHLAAVGEGASVQTYLQGAPIGNTTLVSNLFNEFTVGVNRARSRFFAGTIDDLRVYDQALTGAEIIGIMAGDEAPGLAANPAPGDDALDIPRDASLSWNAGDFAVTHDVYFGTVFNDVNDATTTVDPAGVYKGRQSESTYAPDRLDLGQTYYWRIDEVNAPPDLTVFKGDVWSFTVEPIGYQIVDVNATASSSNAINEGPENTINASGLDTDDLHSAMNIDMWVSSMIGPQPTWIQYELDRAYKLHQMLVWNHNASTELVIGFGIKEATIEYSADGASWTTLGTHEFARAPGAAGYEANTTVDLSGVVAKYIKITANSNWGGFVPQYGLSEVRFFYIPVLPREPNPASGTTDTNVDNVTLNWRAGREAASHDVHLSDSNQALIDGTALVATVSETSYDTGELQLNKSYYWKIVEVNEAETPTSWEGDVLNFMTREFLVVEDFEDYNNFSPDRVFQTWIDGIGYSADEFFPVDNPGNGSGAALGHDIWSYDSPHYDGDIMETAIVHGGTQSAPLYYDNTIAPFTSEIVRTFDVPQDWTKHGIKTLSLWFYGDPNNVAQQMYVKLNGTKVLYDGEAANITRIPWQAWNIELADFTGVDLSNVTELSIGFERIGAVGGSGVVYFDDISLYPYSRELITPAEPDTAGLVARYEFEGTANDSSGNGLHGTAVGDPIFVAGKVGQAISLDGIGDYVEITGYKGILGPNAITVTAWIKTTNTETGTIVNWGTQSGSQRIDFRVDADRLRVEHGDGNVQGDSNVNDGIWHHVAVTVQENATVSYPEVILYLDGIDDTRPSTDPNAFNVTANVDVSIGYRATNNDRFFTGQIDDVRIYDYALSDAEISWLAGRTQPFDKPF